MTSNSIDSVVLSHVEQYIAATRRQLHIPGLAVAIVSNGEVVYQQGIGNAAIGRAVTPSTPFVLGSLSKSFTALAIMQLVEADKLDLDTPVQRYIPWFRVRNGAASPPITVRHLLNHTSGISRYAGRALLSDQSGKTLEQSVREVRYITLAHSPAAWQFEYSNTNYLVLALLVEMVSGESFPSYIQCHIFEPLHMKTSFVDEKRAHLAGLAQGSRWWFGFPLAFDAPYLYDAQGAAFLISSAEDMAQWVLLHLGNGSLGGVRLLSPAGMKELHRPAVSTRKTGSQGAMGWRVEQIGGELILRHGGEVTNFRADMVMLPGHKLGVIVLANCNNGMVAQLGLDQIALNVVRLLLGQPLLRKGLTFRGFYSLANLLIAAISLLQLGSLVQLLRSLVLHRRPTRVGVGSLLALLGDVIGPLVLLWQLPRWTDMPWRGLLLYVPDVSRWIMGMSVISLMKIGVRLCKWFWKSKTAYL